MAKNENEMKKEIYRVQDEQHNPLFRYIVQMQGKCPWITLYLRPKLSASSLWRTACRFNSEKRLTLKKEKIRVRGTVCSFKIHHHLVISPWHLQRRMVTMDIMWINYRETDQVHWDWTKVPVQCRLLFDFAQYIYIGHEG